MCAHFCVSLLSIASEPAAVLEMSRTTTVPVLTVYHARGLKNTQHIGKQDPYVEIICGAQSWQSQPHRGLFHVRLVAAGFQYCNCGGAKYTIGFIEKARGEFYVYMRHMREELWLVNIRFTVADHSETDPITNLYKLNLHGEEMQVLERQLQSTRAAFLRFQPNYLLICL